MATSSPSGPRLPPELLAHLVELVADELEHSVAHGESILDVSRILSKLSRTSRSLHYLAEPPLWTWVVVRSARGVEVLRDSGKAGKIRHLRVRASASERPTILTALGTLFPHAPDLRSLHWHRTSPSPSAPPLDAAALSLRTAMAAHCRALVTLSVRVDEAHDQAEKGILLWGAMGCPRLEELHLLGYGLNSAVSVGIVLSRLKGLKRFVLEPASWPTSRPTVREWAELFARDAPQIESLVLPSELDVLDEARLHVGALRLFEELHKLGSLRLEVGTTAARRTVDFEAVRDVEGLVMNCRVVG